MHRVWRLIVVTSVGSLLVTPLPALAGDEGSDPSVADLIKRIERLEEDKTEMKAEIDELRTELGDDWLTERRAEEIRDLVADVLADADTRASMQDGMTAGWNGNFFLASADGRFKLQVDGMLQLRFLWNYTRRAVGVPNEFLWGFENARTKLTFRGHVFSRDLTYLLRLNVARDEFGAEGNLTTGDGVVHLQDAWAQYQFTDEIAFRVGQFKLPFNREELVSPAQQLVIERSLVNETTNLGRSQGVEFIWSGKHGRFFFAFSDGAEDPTTFAIIGTFPMNTDWIVASLAEYAFTARYEHLFAGTWEQFNSMTSPPGDDFGLLWGIAAHYQRNRLAAAVQTPTWLAVTTDVSVEWGGANLFAAFTYEYMETNANFPVPPPGVGTRGHFANIFGLVVQGGTYFTEKFEGYARLEVGSFDLSGFDFPTNSNLVIATLGGNYYFNGNDVKLSGDVGFSFLDVGNAWPSSIAGWRGQGDGGAPQVVVRTQLQLLF